MSGDDLAVMELSSFQLEIMTRSPQVAAVLNITPNHLDRHGSMQVYTPAKSASLATPDAGTMPACWAAMIPAPGRWRKWRRVAVWTFGLEAPRKRRAGHVLERRARLPGCGWQRDAACARQLVGSLRGEHNLLNVLAACAIAAAAGLPVEAMRAGVEGFCGVPHRLEFVRHWGGADWYNDFIATAPERAMAAIRVVQRADVLLAGGRDKNLPWEDVRRPGAPAGRPPDLVRRSRR